MCERVCVMCEFTIRSLLPRLSRKLSTQANLGKEPVVYRVTLNSSTKASSSTVY